MSRFKLNPFMIPVIAGLGFVLFHEVDSGPSADEVASSFRVDWDAVENWPRSSEQGTTLSAEDMVARRTVLIFDDSGSMGGIMQAAKAATLAGLKAFSGDEVVGVYALNSGELVAPERLDQAFPEIEAKINALQPDGGTPLGTALERAEATLATEAAKSRGYGSFQIVVVTDGEAKGSEEMLMRAMIDKVVQRTPVTIRTIGVGVGEGHPLNLPGVTEYVSAKNPDEISGIFASFAAEDDQFAAVQF